MPADVIECSGPGLKGALCWQLVAGATPRASDTHTLTQGKREREREREGNGTILSLPLPTQLTHLHV